MTTTVNISLPKSMYDDAKKEVTRKGYSSFSEFIRDTLRETLYEDKNRITENGFPVWFEDQVLKAAKESTGNDEVWETEDDMEKWFKKMDKELVARRNAKNH